MMRFTLLSVSMFVAYAVALAAPSPAAAANVDVCYDIDDVFEQHVCFQLAEWGDSLGGLDIFFSPDPDVITGFTNQGETTRHTVSLRGDWENIIVVACDQDCDDIDMSVYDAYGDFVAEDTSTPDDDFNVAAIFELSPGTYDVEITMYQCSVNPCEYAIILIQSDL